MKQSGQIALTPFPYTDLSRTKLRPVLLIRPLATEYGDWLVCMVSSQLHHQDATLDERIQTTDADFVSSGLKVDSLLRLSRLAVLDGALLKGAIGEIAPERLQRIRQKLSDWIAAKL